MFFKDDLPPPRYALDSDLTDQEVPYDTKYELDIGLTKLTGANLLLIAPRLHGLISTLGVSEIGRLKLRTTKTFRPEFVNSNSLEFYETEADIADFASHNDHSIRVFKGPSNYVIIELPTNTTEAEDAFFGSELIKKVQPRQVILGTPGASFMESHICYLASANSIIDVPSYIPLAEPPAQVQGSGASAVSCALRLNIPSFVLALKSEGAVHHEVFSLSSFEEYRKVLINLLGLKVVPPAEVERKVSVLYV